MARKKNSSAIVNLWREHCAAPFPERLAGQEVAGICVASLDTFAAGCIQTFVSHGGRLGDEKVAVLDCCRRDLSVVVKEMNGEAKEYFARLENLARMVLDAVRDAA
jgi:hypothetical protein